MGPIGFTYYFSANILCYPSVEEKFKLKNPMIWYG
jgi:hypothetical protein